MKRLLVVALAALLLACGSENVREPTELDHFVSARWGLHTRWWGRTLPVPNRHEPWPVHDAEAAHEA